MDKQRYKGVCPECGGTLWICKSIMQDMGLLDMGHGTCIHCKTFLHLKFNKGKQEFDCTNWEEYRRQMPEENKEQI